MVLPPSLNIRPPLRKLRRLTKSIVVLNLLIIDVVFTILPSKRENELMFSLEYLLHIVEKDEL
jgi:hypothetical protein